MHQLIIKGHSVTIRVKGNSMRPFLEGRRDKVILAPFGQLNVGNIVLAEITKSQYVLHRIIKIEGHWLTLMGDGNLKGTEECALNNILGVVTTIVRNGKIVDCNNLTWRILFILWTNLLPIRRYLLTIYTRMI